MPLGLHPNLKARLVELIAELLPAFFVVNNAYLDFGALPDLRPLDDALPDAKSQIRQKLASFVGETPLRDFLLGVLSDSLHARAFESDAARIPLVTLPEYADATAVSGALVDKFESLPWDYVVLIPLPHAVAEFLGPVVPPGGYELAADLSFVAVPADGSTYKLRGPESLPFLFTGGKPTGATPGLLHLAVSSYGYIPLFGESAALGLASFKARAFLGLCIAHRIFRRSYLRGLGGPQRRHMLVFQRTEPPYPFQDAYEFAFEIGEAIDSLVVDDVWAKVPPERRPLLLTRELREMGIAVRAHEADDRLLRAAQWLFDSNAGSNSLLNFVQAMICLEILLGDKQISDLVGLGELLGNRCAFLIGKSRLQRDQILADFRRIYDTRSRIVHRGHNRLSAKEEDDLWTLRWFCARVVQEEMRLLLADESRATT